MEQQLTITKQTALKAHSEADNAGKQMLENLFGKRVLFDKVQDRITNFNEVCEDQGKNPTDYVLPTEADQEEIAAVALKKLRLIAKALNEGWEPDFMNQNQYKYYPWFKQSSSAGGFVCAGYDCWHSGTFVGPRLAFKSSELAIYAGKTFIDVYNEYFK